MTDPKKKKEKRILPLRSAGETITNPQTARPSQLLFGEIARLEADDLATQNLEPGNPGENNSETQTVEFGNPNFKNLETQNLKLDNPNQNISETQIPNFGNPNAENLGVIQPKPEIRQPKKRADLDAVQPKEINLETQTSEKTAAGKFKKKYEFARSTEPLHARIEKSINKRIRHFIVDHKYTLKEFVELAAVKFMEEFGNPNPESLGGMQPSDDRRLMILYKTTPAVINLYLEITKNAKWKMSDDAKASRFNDVDIRLVELGMLQTLGNRTEQTKINSFAYFIPEIENWIATAPSEDLKETLLKHYRNRLNPKTNG